MTDSVGLGSPYGDALAQVGLTPDNPDGMYAALMKYIADPVSFKNADSAWQGARDDMIWWQEPAGFAALQWPFHYGRWLDSAPKNYDQIRAVFKIPPGQDVKRFLFNLYRVDPAHAALKVNIQTHAYHGGGIDVGHAITSAASTAVHAIESAPVVGDVVKAAEKAYNDAVPVLAKISGVLIIVAPFLSSVPLVGPALTATALALAALGPALEKLRESGATPGALVGVAQAALAAAPGGSGASLQQLVSSAPQLSDAVSSATQLASSATPTVQQIQQGQQLLQQVIQSTPNLSAVAAKYAPHVLTASVGKSTVPAAHVPAAMKAVRTVAFHAPAAAAAAAQSAVTATGPVRKGYEPYPASVRGAVHGALSGGWQAGGGGGGGHGGGGHGGGGHGGGGHGHGGGHPVASFRHGLPLRRPRGGGPWWWGADWWAPWAYDPVPIDAVTCANWGDPLELSPAMESIGQVQLRNSGGNPATVRGSDGAYYLFTDEGGILTMRRCAATQVLGDAPAHAYPSY